MIRFNASVMRPLLPGRVNAQIPRRSAAEPVIGHLKEHHRMRRCRLKGSASDAINAVLAVVGYNFCACCLAQPYCAYCVDIDRYHWLAAIEARPDRKLRASLKPPQAAPGCPPFAYREIRFA